MRRRLIPAAMLALLVLLAACFPRPEALTVTTIQVDGETYTLPGEVELVWTQTPAEIIWAEPGRRQVIRATPRKPGGGSLTEGARDLAPVLLVLEEGDPGSGRLISMQVTGPWLIYTTELTNPDQPETRTRHLQRISLENPEGSQGIGSATVSARDRFLSAYSENYVVWQRYGPVGPNDRYTRGQTHVFRLGDQREWRLPGAGWGRSLRIEGDTLVIDLRDGGTERVGLQRAEAIGTVEIARADFDGDGQEDLVMGKANRANTYDQVWIKAADGRQLFGPLGGGESAPLAVSVTDVWVHPLGGELPILILADIGGSGGQPLLAFRYDSERQAMAPLPWEEQEREWGFPTLDPATGRMLVAHRTMDYVHHMLNVAYTYRDGRLAEEARWYDPRPEELSYPSDPTFVMLAALMTLTLELPDETQRYFADEATARRFYQAWSEKAPKGAYWSLAGDKGLPEQAQEGAAVPFAVQASVPGGKGESVIAQGRIRFVKQRNRDLIAEITVK